MYLCEVHFVEMHKEQQGTGCPLLLTGCQVGVPQLLQLQHCGKMYACMLSGVALGLPIAACHARPGCSSTPTCFVGAFLTMSIALLSVRTYHVKAVAANATECLYLCAVSGLQQKRQLRDFDVHTCLKSHHVDTVLTSPPILRASALVGFKITKTLMVVSCPLCC